MFMALTSGTMGATIPAGNYNMFVIAAGDSDIVGGPGAATGITSITTLLAPSTGLFLSVPFAVAANGDVSGSFTPPGSTAVMSITGKVQGSSIVFNMINPNQTPGLPPLSVIRVVGVIGLNGSAAGNFTEMSGLNLVPAVPSMHKGVFVGSFIPTSGVNEAGLATFVNNFYTPAVSPGATPSGNGLMHIVARDIFLAPGVAVPRVSWGQAAVTAVDAAAGTASMSDMVMRQDAGSVAANGGATFTMPFSAGRYVRSGIPSISTNLLVFEYTTPTGEKLYIATVVGLRRGVYMVVPTVGPNAGKLTVVGESYMTKAVRSLVPGLSAGVTYDLTVATVRADMPGQTRSDALLGTNGPLQPESKGPLPIPPASTPFDAHNGYFEAPGQGLMAFQGSMMAVKIDVNDLFDNNRYGGAVLNDSLIVFEFFESGAIAGEEMNGGTVTPPWSATPITVRNFPLPVVGFFHQVGSASPSFLGTLNFLARTMYSRDFNNFINAVATGTINITTAPTTTVAGAAILAATDPSGAAINATLTIDAIGSKHGMYHIHGVLSDGNYVDIYWPIGGKKATYAISTGVAGTVDEVGEAYMTQ